MSRQTGHIEELWDVTREDVLRYAAAARDFNSIHMDDASAMRAGYPRAIAHGMLTLGRLLAYVEPLIDPAELHACRCRFAAPALVESRLTFAVTGETATDLTATAVDGNGAVIVEVTVDFGPRALADRPQGELVAESILVVERGPATKFARALGVTSSRYYQPDTFVGRQRGLPTVPTFSFALPGWGWFPELQPDASASEPDAVRDCQEWARSEEAVIHAAQSFAFHQPLRIGDTVRCQTHVLDRFSKRGRSGVLDFTVVAQRLTLPNDQLVVSSTMTLLVSRLRDGPDGATGSR